MKCGYCGTELPSTALFCGECGRSLAQVAAVAGRGSAASPVGMRDTAVIDKVELFVEAAEAPAPVVEVPEPERELEPESEPEPEPEPEREREPEPEPELEPAPEPEPEPEPAPAPVLEPELVPEPVAEPEPTEDNAGDNAEDNTADLEATRLVVPGESSRRFVLQFSTGESVTVFGTGLIGRNPVPEPAEYFDQLVVIVDPGKSVSKTHLEFGQVAGAFWVADRYSGNGSIVREPDADPQRCEPGKRYRVVRGTRVSIGEQFFVVS